MVKQFKDERIDFISGTDLKMIQSPSVFAFSIDAILLGQFVRVPIQKGHILDLCTGNGVIPLFLSTRTKALITGVDIQKELIEFANRNRDLNGRENQVTFIESDLNELPLSIKNRKYDVVVCNPPYFEANQAAEKNLNKHLALARHEITCTLEDVIRVCSGQVKYKGKVAIVHRPERMADIFTEMRKYQLEPKRMQLIHPKKDKAANMVLIEAVKGGQPALEVIPPLVILDEVGNYTDEFKEVYIG
ncbi:tRNA1(Val) (adenine(37)-N6)-methyltransferase [Alkalihalobacillus pseudalcaliphilus]|uniref:tRNA1(Val) (adenine(37)-N6)-methyltransferase n=1 Tax=Alkalihalobacillus pseudalcaliphilus TaxID=79884 RepID=UPI00064DC1CD|nr:tRNA1(Val) (adenine(37)-N6)-methyltransferase [Alkalihalobacillus pseudalcaliphilus]KMK74467.1 hypothetical protein AB990_20265 [Alkalihalobacillus pseudalcaliphilus]